MSIKLKIFKNFIIKLLFFSIITFCIQSVYFLYIYYSENDWNATDLIVVFPGEDKRFQVAKSLIERRTSGKIVFTGLSKSKTAKIVEKLRENNKIKILNGGKSITTFQDVKALKTIIIDHKIKSICLVTSDYHMPRSLFLLKAYLFNCQIKISKYKVHSSYFFKNDMYKIIYNEFLKFWGSLAEMGLDSIGIDLNKTEFKNLNIKKVLKKYLLWAVKIPEN